MRVLVVEDEVGLADTLRRGLTADGFAVQVVHNGEDAVWAFKPTREGNTIVLAQREASQPKRPVLADRAQTIQTRWSLPAPKWLRVFKPVA